MTPDELDAIRAIVTESEGRLRAALDRAVEAIAADFSELRSELTRRMDTLEHRFEIQAPVILSLDARTAALGHSLDQLLVAYDRDAGAKAGLDPILFT